MATNKFPKTYHEGVITTSDPYANRAYNIYTEAGDPLWQPGDGGIDFYTFKDSMPDPTDDSPETSYVLVIIKNQGEAESLLDLSNVAISNPGNVPVNPFSIVTNYNDINVSSSITTGTDGLHTHPHPLPDNIVLDNGEGTSTTYNYGKGNTAFEPLDPAPIGYVRLVTTGESIEDGSNNEENFNDFGSTGVKRYVPFYNPADLMNSDNAIGNTSTDYGSGFEPYPHYAAILIKCDPTEPMEIPAEHVYLNIFHSQYQQINISLVMTAYNVGNIAYEQGWLYKHGINYGFNEADATDTGDWTYSIWSPYSTVTPSSATPGDSNTGMTLPDEPYLPWSTSGSEAAEFDPLLSPQDNFFLPPRPKNLYWNNYNDFLQNDAINQTHADRLPCVRIWDNTSFSGGIQWFHMEGQHLQQSGQKTDYGVHNSNSAYENDSPSNAGLIKTKTLRTANNIANDAGPYSIINDTIQATISNPRIVFSPGASYTGGLRTLSANEYLYLVLDLGDGKQNKTVDAKIHRSYGGTPLFPNAQDIDNDYAFRMNANVYPFYHKDYFVNNNINGQTNKDMIGITWGTYDYLTQPQKQIYRYTKAWKTNNDGVFDSGQPAGEEKWAQHGYALGGSGGFNTNSSSNNPNSDNTFKARTHAITGNIYPGIHSYYKGNRLGSSNMHGIHFDAKNDSNQGVEDPNWDSAEGAVNTSTWSQIPGRGYSKVVSSHGGGWKKVKKHMHLRDIVRIPDIVAANSTTPSDDSYDDATVNPSVTWTILSPEAWTNSGANLNAYASNFPWSNDNLVWNTDSAVWYDGPDTKTGDANRIIRKQNLVGIYTHYSNAAIKCGFVPAGFHRCVTNGAESVAEVASIVQDVGESDSSLEENNSSIFSESSSNWEDTFTIRGFNVKQKTIKLKAKASGQVSLDGSVATTYNIPEYPVTDWHGGYTYNNGNIFSDGHPGNFMLPNQTAPSPNGGNYGSQILDDGVANTGDAIGRFYVATRFTVKQNAAVNYAKTTNTQGNGNLDSSITHDSNVIEFTLWAYFWPRFQRGITSLMTGNLGENGGHMITADKLYTTEWSSQTDAAAVGGVTWGEGTEITDAMVESLAQQKSKVPAPLITDTGEANCFVPQYSSFYEFKIASKQTRDEAYWKKLPFNGRALFKHQRYFEHDIETAQKITMSGFENANDMYGVIPGPRFPGRFPDTTSGDWEWAWKNDKAIYQGTTFYNENTETYDCFIPVNVGILGRQSEYGIQLVNMYLENENLKPSGAPNGDGTYTDPRNRPAHQGVMYGNPLYRWQRNKPSGGNYIGAHMTHTSTTDNYFWSVQTGDNGTSATPEPHQRMTRNAADNGDEMRFIHHAAISDTNTNPQTGMETHELHPIVRTAPLSNITVKNVGSIAATTQDINLLNANIITIKNNVAVANALIEQDKYRAKDAGIRVGQKVYHVHPVTGAKRTNSTQGQSSSNIIPDGATVLAVNNNTITISAATLNTSPVNLGTTALRFDWPQPNYASWCMSRGTRSSWETQAIKAMERNGVAYQKYSPYFIMPFSSVDASSGGLSKWMWWRLGGVTYQGGFPVTTISYPAWDATGSDWRYKIQAFNCMPAGMILPTAGAADAVSVVGTAENIDYIFKEGTLWWNWFKYGQMDGITNAETAAATAHDNYYPIWYQELKWTNLYSQYASIIPDADINDNVFSKIGPHGSVDNGAPHICLSIDKAKAVANQLEYGVFYNTLRIRYLLNNKLENFGLDCEKVGQMHYNQYKGNSYVESAGGQFADNDDNMVNFAEGGAKYAQVYEDTFLVKVVFDASVPALVVSDLEGDAQADETSIDFGILNSN